jgi:hypothetical protein
MPSEEEEGNESDTITVDTRTVYAEHMPPPSNQQQGQLSRKRQASQISTDDLIEDRVNALKERIIKAKEAKRLRLLDQEQELLRELVELEG